MVVTFQQVLDALYPDEPNYSVAAKLGPSALPHLETLIKTGDPMLASKATYLASLISDERTQDLVRIASQSKHVVVRVAAASAIDNLPKISGEFLSSFEKDTDSNVRRIASKSKHHKKRHE